jgi:hypothetical protein
MACKITGFMLAHCWRDVYADVMALSFRTYPTPSISSLGHLIICPVVSAFIPLLTVIFSKNTIKVHIIISRMVDWQNRILQRGEIKQIQGASIPGA